MHYVLKIFNEMTFYRTLFVSLSCTLYKLIIVIGEYMQKDKNKTKQIELIIIKKRLSVSRLCPFDK